MVDVDRVTVRYDHALALMADLRAMGETSVLVEGAGRPLTRALLARAAELYAERFAASRRPHPRHLRDPHPDRLGAARSQQQPLRPAPRKLRLADALGTKEQSAGEKAGG